MNITINRSELSDAVNRATAVAPEASPVKELSGVLLEADVSAKSLTVTATNLEMTLEQRLNCDTGEDDALVVNAVLFAAMLKKLPGESVTLHRKDGCAALLVESGDAAYSIPALERKGFPHTEVAFPDDTVKVSGVPSMVRHSSFAVSARNQNPLLKCINLKFTRDGLVAVGSDGIRLVSTKGDSKSTGDIALLVPAASLNTLARLCSDKDEFHVGTTDKSIVFRKPNLTFTARIVEEEYVDTDRIISSLSNAFTVLTDVAELKRALSCVAAATNADGRVRMSFDGMKLTLFATGAYGAANTSIEVTPLTGAPSGSFWYVGKSLFDCFRALSGTATLGVAQNGMLTLSTEETFYLQPSVRPPQPKTAPKAEKKAEKEEKPKRKAPAKKSRGKKAA